MVRERRRFPRVPETFQVRYRIYGDLVESWREVTALNLSAGGVRFRTPDPLEAGTSLSLEVQLPGAQPIAVRGRVIWSQMQAAGVMESGVEFLDVAPEHRALIDQVVGFLGRRG